MCVFEDKQAKAYVERKSLEWDSVNKTSVRKCLSFHWIPSVSFMFSLH